MHHPIVAECPKREGEDEREVRVNVSYVLTMGLYPPDLTNVDSLGSCREECSTLITWTVPELGIKPGTVLKVVYSLGGRYTLVYTHPMYPGIHLPGICTTVHPWVHLPTPAVRSIDVSATLVQR